MVARRTFSRSHRLRAVGVGLSVGVATSMLATLPTPSDAAPPSPRRAADPAPTEAQALARAAIEATRTGADVEVPSMTTETNQVLAQPDGTFQLEAHREPVRTDINGDWEPIDTTLQIGPDGSIRPKAITIPVEFAPGGDNELVTAGEGADSVSFTWDEGTLPEPIVSGSQITYPDVRPGVDMVFTANATGYSDALVVKSPTAAEALLDEPAALTGTSSGLDLSMTPEGALVGENSDSGIALVSPPPIAWDSSADGRGDDQPDATTSGTGVVHELEPATIEEPSADKEATVKLEVAPPAALVNDPATVYPLYLDPAITGKGNTHYLTVHSKGWNYYDAANQVMRVGYCNWDECNTSIQGNARSFFSFKIDPLAIAGSDPIVYSAKVQATQVWNATSAAQPVNLRKAQPFTAGTNYPGPVGAQLEQISSAGGHNGGTATLSFDNANVKDYLQARATDDDEWVQFALSAPAEGNRDYWKKFSNDTKLTVKFGYPPTINSYTTTGVVTCPGKPVMSRGPLTTNVNATEIYPGTGLEYQWEIYRPDGTTLVGRRPVATPANGGWSTTPSQAFDLPNGPYTWRVRVGQNIEGTDDHAERATNPLVRPFTVDRDAPSAPVVTSHDFPRDYWGRPAVSAGGSFAVSVPTDAAGIAYAFNGAPASISDDRCDYTTSGYAKRISGTTIDLTAPSNLEEGVPNTLKVYAFDDAHNLSASTTYTFYPGRDLDGSTATNRVEIETQGVVDPPDPAAPVTIEGVVDPNGPAPIPTPGPGNHVTITSEGSDRYAYINLTPSAEGYYALGAQLATCSTCSRVTFRVEGAQAFKPQPVDASDGVNGTYYAQIGGYLLSARPYKIRIELPDAAPGSPSSVKLDYLTLVPIRSGAYPSLAKAFNNDGIVSEGSANSMGLEPPTEGAQPEPIRSLSRQALAAAGVVPGQSFTASFTSNIGDQVTNTFAVPPESAEGFDNAVAAGQEITLPPGVKADHVDFLVAATCAPVGPYASRMFDLRHTAQGGPPLVQNIGVPYSVPEWRKPDLDANPAMPSVTLDRFVSGPSATVAIGAVKLYVLEVDVEDQRKGLDLQSVTLPSTGASLTSTASGCGRQPRLHVFAMATRND